MNTTTPTDTNVMVWNPKGRSSVVVVCEHASCFIPETYDNLGLVDTALKSHAAWDPGALVVARGLAARLDAVVVASTVSRLVYDCNRPPSADSAIPDQSETIKIPGNVNLSPDQRQERAATVYEPFRATMAATIAAVDMPVIVTIHSFTPVYHGEARVVEIGILHDTDARLADAMLQTASAHTDMLVMRNAPYGPEHGVTHTLKEHALPAGHLNVMIEVRNDLIDTQTKQDAMADCMSKWVSDALMQLQSAGDVQCQA